MAAGQFNSLALTADGRVWSWGYNTYGQLGTGSNALFDPVPKQPTGLSNVTAIAAGGYHSLAIDRQGMVYAWGLNHVGQLGTLPVFDTKTPSWVQGPGFYIGDLVSIAAGAYHTVAVMEDGRTWAWGWGAYGQLLGASAAPRAAINPRSCPASSRA